MPNLAVFDLDHTLLATDSDYSWGRYLATHGLVDGEAYERGNRQFYEDYMNGRLDVAAHCRFAFAPLAQHPLEVLLPLRERFVREEIAPRVAPGAPALLARHRAAGDTLLITTATNRFVTEPIAALLGVDHLIATDPVFADGRYTGELDGVANFGPGKVVRLKQWLAQQAQPYASLSCYSDSRNDIPLLELGDRAVAVNPDTVLRSEAEKRGWPILDLR